MYSRREEGKSEKYHTGGGGFDRYRGHGPGGAYSPSNSPLGHYASQQEQEKKEKERKEQWDEEKIREKYKDKNKDEQQKKRGTTDEERKRREEERRQLQRREPASIEDAIKAVEEAIEKEKKVIRVD